MKIRTSKELRDYLSWELMKLKGNFVSPRECLLDMAVVEFYKHLNEMGFVWGCDLNDYEISEDEMLTMWECADALASYPESSWEPEDTIADVLYKVWLKIDACINEKPSLSQDLEYSYSCGRIYGMISVYEAVSSFIPKSELNKLIKLKEESGCYERLI